MQQHLETGCAECLKNSDIWRGVVELANRETGCEPPAWAIRAVNASFAVHKAVRRPTERLELATLLLDSMLQPAVAGVRGTPAVARQLLYKAGSLCIDMRLQTKPGSDSMVLVGQLLDSTKPDHGISGIPVSLIAKGGKVVKGKTNKVGEFDFGITSFGQIHLVFGMGKSRTIIVPVPNAKKDQDLA